MQLCNVNTERLLIAILQEKWVKIREEHVTRSVTCIVYNKTHVIDTRVLYTTHYTHFTVYHTDEQ